MRRVLPWLGIGMIAAGLGLLGWFVWQFWGTNIIAKQKQEAHVERLQKQWRAPSDPSVEAGEIALGNTSALIRIPRFGDAYVMPVLEGTSDDVLAQGFGHFEDSADPGAVGNYALAAHRVTHGEPLRDMPKLRPGDEVEVETRNAVYTYVLNTDPNDLVVPFTDTWVVASRPVNPDGGVGPTGNRIITLTTCSEIFHTDERMIAFGRLESTEEK